MWVNLFKRFRRFLFWLWQQEGTPAQRARGIAVGVFSGCFPFFGLQTLFGIMLASLFRGNRLLAVTGTWISNPLTYVPLYWFNYQIGSYFLGRVENLQNLSIQEMWFQGWLVINRTLLGSSVVGLIAGSMSGCICYLLLKRFADKKPIRLHLD